MPQIFQNAHAMLTFKKNIHIQSARTATLTPTTNAIARRFPSPPAALP
jgi:hypothetical protein